MLQWMPYPHKPQKLKSSAAVERLDGLAYERDYHVASFKQYYETAFHKEVWGIDTRSLNSSPRIIRETIELRSEVNTSVVQYLC